MKYLIINFYLLIVIKKRKRYTDNLIKSRFAFRQRRKKKIGSNRRLAAGRLKIDFKKPFDLLAKLPAEARGEAPSEAANSIWWCLLDEIRTHFEQNPEDFAD